MEAAVSQGWQNAKTLVECNMYMLENQIDCNVTFSFPCGSGEPVKLKAHKYVLISRSTVFEAMLRGDFQESSKEVEITDIDVETFKQILLYLYCDKVELSESNVMPILFGAKKCLLDHLTEECKAYAVEVLGFKNVCTILNHSILYDDREMIQTCVKYVTSHAKQVFRCKDFFHASKSTLKKILQIHTAFLPEITILESCIKWAKRNRTRGQTLRDTLGDCIFDIRFNMMDSKDLLQILNGESNLLADSELVQFLHHQINPRSYVNDIVKAGFNLTPRISFDFVNRFELISSKPEWHTGNTYDMIKFIVARSIYLHGISVFGGGQKGVCQKVEVQLICDETDEIFRKVKRTFISTGTNEPVPIIFENPVPIMGNDDLFCKIAVKVQGPYTYCGVSRFDTGLDSYLFEFVSCANGNGTDTTKGQIPQLFYTLI